jgi:hypothetical protein
MRAHGSGHPAGHWLQLVEPTVRLRQGSAEHGGIAEIELDHTLVGDRAGGGNDLLAGNDSISAEDLIDDIVDGGAGPERARIDVRLDRVQRVGDTRSRPARGGHATRGLTRTRRLMRA